MTTVSQFQAMIPLGDAVDLYRMLASALTERGATPHAAEVYRLRGISLTRDILCHLYDKLMEILNGFLVDPGEISLNSLLNGNVRCHNISTLTQSRQNGFLVPISGVWNDPSPLLESRESWPGGICDPVEFQYSRPHFLPRLYGEYFRQAAEMIRPLRYFALPSLNFSITIPSLAGTGTRSHIYAIRKNISGEPVLLTKIWSSYLSPGRYYLDDFGQFRTEEYPTALLAGYVDLQDNLQFFTT